MPELRDYQQDLLGQVEVALETPKARVMLQLPTGGGKTRIAAELLARWTRGGDKAAWLTHRRELSTQTCRVLNDAGVGAREYPSRAWATGDPAPTMTGGVAILMAQTVSSRDRHIRHVWKNYRQHDLLVVDEAHHAPSRSWKRAISQWPGRVVGLTATPWRLAKIQGFKGIFDCLLLGPQIKDMQATGSLAKARVLMPDSDELILGGEIGHNRDYSELGIEIANKDRDIWTAGALQYWQSYAEECQTIVYAVTVKHAQNIADLFLDAGIPAKVLSSETPQIQRYDILDQFKGGTLKALINVDIATEGFDLPGASCILMARPTLSLALYLQMVGRGLRPKPDRSDCLILDLAGNVERHGLPDVDRQWSLERRGQVSDGPPPVVRCPDCEAVSPAASHRCQSCDYEFGKNCQRCGSWRAWDRWSAETHCGDEHDPVCNRCHFDAHQRPDLPELPFDGGLKEMLKGELALMNQEVNASNLHTLKDVQVRISEVAEQLVHAMRIENMDTFERMTEQLRPLLRRERQLRKEEYEQGVKDLVSSMNEELQDEETRDRLIKIRDRISEVYGGKKRLAGVNMKFGPEPIGDIYYEITESGTVVGYCSFEPVLEEVVSDEEEDSLDG